MRQRIASFGFALQGLWTLVRTQVNARIHAAATVVVAAVGLRLDLERHDWALVVVAIGIVWVAEALNTGIEFLADAAVPDTHSLVKHAKDVAAAGVLLASLTAFVLGLIVFVPHLSS